MVYLYHRVYWPAADPPSPSSTRTSLCTHHSNAAVSVNAVAKCQQFDGPFSGTTRVSRWQERTSGLYGPRED